MVEIAEPQQGLTVAEIIQQMQQKLLGASATRKEVEKVAEKLVQSRCSSDGATLQEKMRLFVQLCKWQKEIEAHLEDCKKFIEGIEPEILEGMAESGLENARIDGMTVFTKRARYVSKAKGVTTETVVEALEEVGLGYLVDTGYNAQSLKSRILEITDAGEEVPEKLKALLNIGEVVQLSARKA